MKTAMRMKAEFLCSLRTAEMATPRTHMIITLYTDIPTYYTTGGHHGKYVKKETQHVRNI